MKFEQPAGSNPVDRLQVVGRPVDRIDGVRKVCGTAGYAYERHDVVARPAYGWIIGAGIARGRISAIDVRAARASAGVLAIVTAENAGRLGKGDMNTVRLLGGPEVDHYHQAIGVVVAETFEEARAAAQLVQVRYERGAGNFDLEAARASASIPEGDGL